MNKKKIIAIAKKVSEKWYGVLVDTVAMYSDGSSAIVFAVDTEVTVQFVIVEVNKKENVNDIIERANTRIAFTICAERIKHV
jgi:hypothetical protein